MFSVVAIDVRLTAGGGHVEEIIYTAVLKTNGPMHEVNYLKHKQK